MKIKIRFSFLLILFLPFLVLFVNAKIYWAFHILVFIVIYMEEKRLYKTKNISILLLLGIPLLWASLFSFNASLSSIIKSLFYLITPLLFTFIGIQIAKITSQEIILKYLVYSGTIGSLFYVILASYLLGFKAFMDPYAMRELYTWGSITTALTPIIILFSEKYGIVLLKNRKSKILIILINLIALYLTASRTYYFIFLVFLFIFLYKINKRKLALIGTIMAIVMILTINLNSDSKLATKIISTITETNISDYNSAADINNKYRGYETYMALKTYLNGTPLNLLLGHGFQKEVDLGTYVMLGDTQRRFIPILHNGYAYQLLREGLLGLILVIIFFVKIFRLKPIDDISNFNYQIAIGSILSLLFSNFVISTFFSAEMLQLWLFIGTYLVCIEMKKKSIIPIGVEYVKKEEQV